MYERGVYFKVLEKIVFLFMVLILRVKVGKNTSLIREILM